MPGPEALGGSPEEHERIRRLYEETYRAEKFDRRWRGPGMLLNHQREWDLVRAVLKDLGFPRPGARVLDLGAGWGADCVEMERLGWERSGILAIDLRRNDVRRSATGLPWVRWMVGDAARLPIVDGGVDLVFQSVMISTVLDEDLRGAIFREVARVLKPGGAFVSYDMRYPNPWNRDHRPLRAASLRRAFPGWKVQMSSVTLLPPLARKLAPISTALFLAAEAVPPLRSHLLTCAVKP